MQNVVRRLAGKPDGLYMVEGRCYRVARLFDVCTPRREEVSKKVARLYRNGVYVGICTIIFEVDRDVCSAVAKALKESYIDSADSK
jgi:hypothetical protein